MRRGSSFHKYYARNFAISFTLFECVCRNFSSISRTFARWYDSDVGAWCTPTIGHNFLLDYIKLNHMNIVVDNSLSDVILFQKKSVSVRNRPNSNSKLNPKLNYSFSRAVVRNGVVCRGFSIANQIMENGADSKRCWNVIYWPNPKCVHNLPLCLIVAWL